MQEFREAVLNYVKLTDEITESSKALNLSRKRLKELQAHIIQHMTDHSIDQCNLKDGTLILKQSKAPPPLNKDLMVEALQEELGPEKADALVKKVEEHRESNLQTKQTLKRTRAKAGASKPAAADSAPTGT